MFRGRNRQRYQLPHVVIARWFQRHSFLKRPGWYFPQVLLPFQEQPSSFPTRLLELLRKDLFHQNQLQ